MLSIVWHETTIVPENLKHWFVRVHITNREI
jgi:hypothetical protein